MKTKSAWFCSECGNKQTKWTGQCPACNEWNTFSEELVQQEAPPRYLATPKEQSRPLRLKEISQEKEQRLKTGMAEMDRLLGGGVIPGSLLLVGGNPGIGKSTLLLQISQAIASQGRLVLYVCGEESVEQTSLRAKRLGVKSDHLLLLHETNLAQVISHLDTLQPELLIIDSIQIVYKPEISSAPGSVTQVRETASELMQLAKTRNIATLLIGHVTKSGEIAGPRVLEHLVDTVLYFEGEQQHGYRIVRAVKNRFGSTDEIALFQMDKSGLIELPNPSELFLQARGTEAIGSVIIPTIEGSRPILVEAQALVTPTAFSTPSRRSTGLDPNRLALLLAVLEKRLRFQLWRYDIFVSIAGGICIREPAIDLGLLLAITSSLRNQPIDRELVAVGEVVLSGEVRPIPQIESRVREAQKMGFSRCIVPQKSLKSLEPPEGIELIGALRVEDAVKRLLK